MNGKRTVRVVVDALMTVMIVFEMFIQLTGEFLHEVVGFAFFVTVLAHVLLSMKWVKGTARAAGSGKLTGRRTALAVVGVLLAVTTVVLGISSIAISGILASAGFVWALGSYAMWEYVHMVSAYALCGLVVVHLAMHWAFLASAFKVTYNPSRRRAIKAGVNAAAFLGVVALGATAAGKAVAQSAGGAGTLGGSAGDGAGASETSDAPASQAEEAGVDSDKSGKGKGLRKRGDSSGSAGAPDGAGATGSAGASGDAGATGSAGASGATGSTGSSSGICTLCRKQCPLSAPKCDKPYAAGLL